VLADGTGVEKAARNAGIDVRVPFSADRTDSSRERTGVEAFAVLETAPCLQPAAGVA
jgi:catalase-peroxidase